MMLKQKTFTNYQLSAICKATVMRSSHKRKQVPSLVISAETAFAIVGGGLVTAGGVDVTPVVRYGFGLRLTAHGQERSNDKKYRFFHI